MKDDGIRDRLNSALPDVDASEREQVSPMLLTSITERMGASMAPVRALPATWVLVTVLVIATTVAATAGAAILGMAGVRTMSGGAAFLILSSAICLAAFTAVTCVQVGIPGSRKLVSPTVLLVTEALTLSVIFAACFRNYETDDFVAQGMRCLIAGMAQAVPAGLLTVLILRRCFPVDARATGLAQGLLAGLAGVLMLTLHCARLQVPHLALWHTAVLPVSAACGAAIAVAVQRRAHLRTR